MEPRIQNIIRERRIDLGLTMKELAMRIGVSEGTISRWESGNIGNMRRDKVARLSKELEIPLEVLMGWQTDADRFEQTAKAFNESNPNLLTVQEKEHLKIYRMLSDSGKSQVEDFANSVLKVENMQKQVQEPQLLAAHKIENTGMTDEELAKADADDLELLRKFHDMDAKTE